MTTEYEYDLNALNEVTGQVMNSCDELYKQVCAFKQWAIDNGNDECDLLASKLQEAIDSINLHGLATTIYSVAFKISMTVGRSLETP